MPKIVNRFSAKRDASSKIVHLVETVKVLDTLILSPLRTEYVLFHKAPFFLLDCVSFSVSEI